MPETIVRNVSSGKRWWGEFDLEPGVWAEWLIGPRQFLARSMPDEWRFAWRTGDNMFSETVKYSVDAGIEPSEPDFELRRYAVAGAGDRLRLTPKLADRPVIIRPETTLFLPPGEEATLYVSTGVWMSVATTGARNEELFEIPVYRPSDTWFGPSTLEGELCYTAVTSARTRPDYLAQVPHRAFTPVNISNNGSDALEIEYLRLPVTLLSLYAGSSGRLWTDQISFAREPGESSASLSITEHEALQSNKDMRLSGPRETESGGIVHSFSRIFGKVS